ncbi:ribonuclease H-like domain-containing protein [Tanacetum coccineum]
MVRSMWLLKHKFHADGTLSHYKARLVVNDSSQHQQLGVDIDETFSPVFKLVTIHTVLSLVMYCQWPIHQLYVKNAFLNGDLSETVCEPYAYCVAQLTALIAELQAMEDQEEVHDSLLAAKDAKRGEQAKLVALNDVIAEALDEIETLENNVEMLDGSVEGCSTARLQVLNVPFFILDKLGEVAESPRLSDKMKVVFDQARKEEASFAALMRNLCCSLRVSLSKKCRLAAELEGLREQGDAVRALENMKEIVARDFVTLGNLEQLLARTQIGVDLKDGYLAYVEEKVYVFVRILDFFGVLLRHHHSLELEFPSLLDIRR